MPERCVREATWQVLEKGSSGAREVCEREGAWQVLEKGSSGAREVCEKELGRVASLGGRGVRERSLGSEEVCERKGFVPSLPFLSFSQVYCWCEREETLLEFRGPPLLGVGWCVREVQEVRERRSLAEVVREELGSCERKELGCKRFEREVDNLYFSLECLLV